MARERKFGKINKMGEKFENYSYIINGVGGIGKTTLVHEIGKIITGSDEGTFIITCGGENKPKHIPNAFGDVAPDFKTFVAIVKELCENREAYPDTKFVAIDSLDEYARITEAFVAAEYNASVDINERVKSISQAYKGYQKGESRAFDLMVQHVIKLQNAGYSILEIGHTKIKTKEDILTKVQFEQLTCNLDNKYYNAFKDKVNLVAMCYWEHVVDNIEERKNAFTKKMNKVGDLVDRKRVMVFADDDNAIDCKTHFEYIAHKIDLSAAGFIKAVEDAIALKLKLGGGSIIKDETTEVSKPVEEEVEVDDAYEEEASVDAIDDTPPFDVDDVVEEVDKSVIMDEIRKAFKTADATVKKAVKTILTEKGSGMLSEDLDVEVLMEIKEVLS